MQRESAFVVVESDSTVEVQATLLQAAAQNNVGTGRIPYSFKGPLEIVGCYPSVIAGSSNGGALVAPTLDDILVLIDINDERRLGARLEQTAQADQRAGYITLGALGAARAQRNLRLKLRNAKPDIGVEFRWKRPWGGAAVYEDAIVCLAFFTRPLQEDER